MLDGVSSKQGLLDVDRLNEALLDLSRVCALMLVGCWCGSGASLDRVFERLSTKVSAGERLLLIGATLGIEDGKGTAPKIFTKGDGHIAFSSTIQPLAALTRVLRLSPDLVASELLRASGWASSLRPFGSMGLRPAGFWSRPTDPVEVTVGKVAGEIEIFMIPRNGHLVIWNNGRELYTKPLRTVLEKVSVSESPARRSEGLGIQGHRLFFEVAGELNFDDAGLVLLSACQGKYDSGGNPEKYAQTAAVLDSLKLRSPALAHSYYAVALGCGDENTAKAIERRVGHLPPDG
jgi:hypothetical protein